VFALDLLLYSLRLFVHLIGQGYTLPTDELMCIQPRRLLQNSSATNAICITLHEGPTDIGKISINLLRAFVFVGERVSGNKGYYVTCGRLLVRYTLVERI
jgi:hypothetical protein